MRVLEVMLCARVAIALDRFVIGAVFERLISATKSGSTSILRKGLARGMEGAERINGTENGTWRN